MAFLLDANVFIQAKRLHYGFDFCPAFWEWLDRANANGRVYSIEKVANEIEAGRDELAEWAHLRAETFFQKPDQGSLPALARVATWVRSQRYDAGAVSTFLQVADYYLVAQALAGEHTVVTHEKADDSIRRVKIPNACIALGIPCMTPFEMLRAERARFVLGAQI